MDIETKILLFIHRVGQVDKNNLVKMLFLDCECDEEINELMNRLRNVDIDSTVSSLKQKNLLIETDNMLSVSPEKQEQLLNSKSKKIIGNSRPLALELTWNGYFTPLIKHHLWNNFYMILKREIDSNSSIKMITDSSIFIDGKIDMTFRIFRIEARLTLRNNSFSIESRSSIPDIPITEGVDHPISMIERIPRDKDTFPTMTAPNLFANYFIFSLLKKALKEVEEDHEPFIQITLPHLSQLIGEDVYQNHD